MYSTLSALQLLYFREVSSRGAGPAVLAAALLRSDSISLSTSSLDLCLKYSSSLDDDDDEPELTGCEYFRLRALCCSCSCFFFTSSFRLNFGLTFSVLKPLRDSWARDDVGRGGCDLA